MTGSIQMRLIGSICGTLLGAVVTTYAYKVQGGLGQSFAFAGGVIGGIAGFTAVTRQLRLQYLGAAIGSVAALTLFQVPVCDGSHLVMPAIGAAIGASLGAIPQSILDRKTAHIKSVDRTDPLQSTNG
jgi:hypothetical protein